MFQYIIKYYISKTTLILPTFNTPIKYIYYQNMTLSFGTEFWNASEVKVLHLYEYYTKRAFFFTIYVIKLLTFNFISRIFTNLLVSKVVQLNPNSRVVLLKQMATRISVYPSTTLQRPLLRDIELVWYYYGVLRS